MHDPMTVAHEICYPWRKYRKPTNNFERTYRESFITIWHCDPETDGSDDSCGWFRPSLTSEDLAWCHEVIKEAGNAPTPGYSCLEALCALWRHARKRVWGTHLREPLSHKHLAYLVELASVPWDNLRDCVVGFHGADDYDSARLMMILLKGAKEMDRPWWKHPRWHIHHWKIQVHPWQKFRRMFERCDRCGRRYSYGYCPVRSGSRTMCHQCAENDLAERKGRAPRKVGR